MCIRDRDEDPLGQQGECEQTLSFAAVEGNIRKPPSSFCSYTPHAWEKIGSEIRPTGVCYLENGVAVTGIPYACEALPRKKWWLPQYDNIAIRVAY